MSERPLYAIANERISFDTAMAWAGAGSAGTRERGVKVTCPSCDEAGAMRVYPDHGWCFSEQKYFSPVGLLAEAWDLDREEAAIRALRKIGYVPAGHARLWDKAEREPDPALDHLAGALRTYCARVCPDWAVRQYDAPVARALSRCLGLLPSVRTDADCGGWLAAAKTVMGRVLSRPSGNNLT